MKLPILISGLIFLLYGCASPLPFQNYDYTNDPEYITHPDKIIVTKDDITNRSYKVLKDIRRSVGKTTLFHDDPYSQACRSIA